MRRSLLAGLIVAGVLSTMLPANAAVADEVTSTTSVTIDAPTSFSAISGAADVTFTISADPAHPPVRAIVQLGVSFDGSLSAPTTVVRDIPAGTCDSVCTLTVPVDTTTWTRVDPGQLDPNRYDGSTDLRVRVEDGATGALARQTNTVDNGAPIIDDAGSWGNLGLVPVDGLLTVPAYTRPDYVGFDPAVRVLVYVAGSTLQAEAAKVSRGTWAWTGSVASFSAGPHLIRVVAFNAAGVASPPRDWSFTIDLGPVASVTGLPEGLLPTDSALLPPLTVTAEPSMWGDVWVSEVLIRVDGVVFGGYTGLYSYQRTMSASWLGATVPAGVHTVTVVVRDNRGLEATVLTRQVEFDAGPTLNVTATGPFVDIGNARPVLELTAAAYPGTTLTSWTMSIDEDHYVSGSFCNPTCPTSAVLRPTWPSEERFTSPGSHFLVFAATDSVGVRTRRLLTVQSVPGSRVTATAPTRAVYGSAVVVTGVARDTMNRTLVGARATLQALPAGSTLWQTIGSSTTDVEGRVSLRTTARGNGAWRILLAGKPGVYAAGVSPTVRTAVSATVVVTRPSSTVYARRAATFSVRSWPYEPAVVSVQVRRAGTTTWLTVARPTLRASTSGSGLAAASVTLPRSGVYYVRAVRASTAKAVGATSALLGVRVW